MMVLSMVVHGRLFLVDSGSLEGAVVGRPVVVPLAGVGGTGMGLGRAVVSLPDGLPDLRRRDPCGGLHFVDWLGQDLHEAVVHAVVDVVAVGLLRVVPPVVGGRVRAAEVWGHGGLVVRANCVVFRCDGTLPKNVSHTIPM